MTWKGKSLEERVRLAVSEEIEMVPYALEWPGIFEKEKDFLLRLFPEGIRRVEHVGSTAVPGLVAKPVVDMLVEVFSLKETKERIVPLLESRGYDYFWRPTLGEETPPFYAWFIKRDQAGKRTHHIHMVEKDFPQWDMLYFRDYLIRFPEKAKEYGELKKTQAEKFRKDRVAYTQGKTGFIVKTTEEAKRYFYK